MLSVIFFVLYLCIDILNLKGKILFLFVLSFILLDVYFYFSWWGFLWILILLINVLVFFLVFFICVYDEFFFFICLRRFRSKIF